MAVRIDGKALAARVKAQVAAEAAVGFIIQTLVIIAVELVVVYQELMVKQFILVIQ